MKNVIFSLLCCAGLSLFSYQASASNHNHTAETEAQQQHADHQHALTRQEAHLGQTVQFFEHTRDGAQRRCSDQSRHELDLTTAENAVAQDVSAHQHTGCNCDEQCAARCSQQCECPTCAQHNTTENGEGHSCADCHGQHRNHHLTAAFGTQDDQQVDRCPHHQ